MKNGSRTQETKAHFDGRPLEAANAPEQTLLPGCGASYREREEGVEKVRHAVLKRRYELRGKA
jgi:hypothetical protein